MIVIDDGGYGAERYACVISDRPSDLVDFDNPDYAGVASAMGLDSLPRHNPRGAYGGAARMPSDPPANTDPGDRRSGRVLV